MKIAIQNQIIDSINRVLPEVVERDVAIPNIPNKTHSIIGMRRTGKTYFMFQKIQDYLKQGVDRSRLVYLNFEDERLIDMTVNDLHWIIDEYYALYPENRSQPVFFFWMKFK
ncbi:MAG: hypothetical protein OMM_10355 [Candidatus Magnetoglobus multicellularis str. Araruama]|uniref:AAA domain-containing protein n=1 Tax=Candidatus Magnetoglobus multicellularis str. Araruama TaxID=890399 RepID=A0A1V1P1I7_9BACT|nr:MAG: hypothetical protein OMM_10355 [Candidatus Magnetoglobus multicellularis str. Araruama]